MPKELEEKSRGIQLDCRGEIARIEIKGPTDAFLKFIEELKSRISEDFRYINQTFLLLLDQIKELEKTFADEFGGENTVKEIENFEMTINREMGSITDSFNIYKTINEVKSVVIEKLKKIKSLVSIKKEKEMRRAQTARENIHRLQNRIKKAELEARNMSKRAEQYHVVAMKDALTGLYNRRAFDARIQGAFKRFQETGEPFTVILVDIDKFKEINDTFGHAAGDKVLQKVAQCLEDTFRKDDFIARFGGDEFVIMIDDLTEEMAKERILNFTKSLKKRRFYSYKEGNVTLTASAGFAMTQEGDTPASLLGRADQAMYDSKKNRR
jgi:diguanylate cyclase (GGDEF)-like protein